jgi:hypothetical protein
VKVCCFGGRGSLNRTFLTFRTVALFGTGMALPLVFLFIPCSSGAFLPSCKAGAHGFAGDLTLAGTGIELRGEVNRVKAAFEDKEEVVRGIDE